MKISFSTFNPKQTPRHLVVLLTILFVVVLIGIIPKYMSLANLDERVKKIQLEVEEQEGLYSIYQSLKSREQKSMKALPLPAKGRLSKDQTETVFGSLRDIAKKVNMDTLYVSPDMGSLGPDSRYLLVNVGLRGDFFNFRKFLTGLGELPYLERIEEIQIQENADIMEFKMKIWLAMA
jgi:hypothetical protein